MKKEFKQNEKKNDTINDIIDLDVSRYYKNI